MKNHPKSRQHPNKISSDCIPFYGCPPIKGEIPKDVLLRNELPPTGRNAVIRITGNKQLLHNPQLNKLANAIRTRYGLIIEFIEKKEQRITVTIGSQLLYSTSNPNDPFPAEDDVFSQIETYGVQPL